MVAQTMTNSNAKKDFIFEISHKDILIKLFPTLATEDLGAEMPPADWIMWNNPSHNIRAYKNDNMFLLFDLIECALGKYRAISNVVNYRSVLVGRGYFCPYYNTLLNIAKAITYAQYKGNLDAATKAAANDRGAIRSKIAKLRVIQKELQDILCLDMSSKQYDHLSSIPIDASGINGPNIDDIYLKLTNLLDDDIKIINARDAIGRRIHGLENEIERRKREFSGIEHCDGILVSELGRIWAELSNHPPRCSSEKFIKFVEVTYKIIGDYHANSSNGELFKRTFINKIIKRVNKNEIHHLSFSSRARIMDIMANNQSSIKLRDRIYNLPLFNNTEFCTHLMSRGLTIEDWINRRLASEYRIESMLCRYQYLVDQGIDAPKHVKAEIAAMDLYSKNKYLMEFRRCYKSNPPLSNDGLL